VHVCSEGDASSIGAVLLGMRAMGILKSWDEAGKYISANETYTPVKKQTKTYRRNFELFSKMYEILKPAMHEITGWQERAE
jgi:sugar (pentulose or hexulose) kinase